MDSVSGMSPKAKPWIRLPADPGYEPQAPMDSAPSLVGTADVVEITPANRAPVKTADKGAAVEYEIEIDVATAPSAAATTEVPGAVASSPPNAQEAADLRVPSQQDNSLHGAEMASVAAPVTAPVAAPAEVEIAVSPVSVDVRPAGVVAGLSPSAMKQIAESVGLLGEFVELAIPQSSIFRRSRKASADTATAPAAPQRLKLLIYGATGTGKTLTGLSFGRALVSDLEDGASIYEDAFDFTALDPTAFGGPETNDWLRLSATADYLLAHPEITSGFEAWLIDPFTVADEALRDLWTSRFLARREGGRGGHKIDFYDWQPADWRYYKADLKAFFRKIAKLPLHVICTAREKPLYAEGSLMKKIGETFDAERNLPYYFDVTVRLRKHPTEAEVFEATVMKARNFFLPRPRYVYRGATGLYEVISGRLAGEPDPRPKHEINININININENAEKPTTSRATDAAPAGIGFDGHVEIEIG